MPLMGQATRQRDWAGRLPPPPPPPALTVRQVIEKLQAFPPESLVEVPEGDGFWEPCSSVTLLETQGETGKVLYVQIGGPRWTKPVT